MKLNIQKTKIKAFGPSTSLETEEEKVEVMTDFFFFLGFKITEDVTATMKLKQTRSLEGKL